MKAKLASHNENKLHELAHVLEGWQLALLAADDYPSEDGATYYENARGKADYGRGLAEDEWVLGEDSGIEVAALDGRPGIRSARFGGDHPVGSLLAELGDAEERAARYVCELVAISPAGNELRGTGVLVGRIATEPRGSEGFGYDPVFVPEGETRTVAELGNDWKRANSHRARAARDLLRQAGGLV